MNYLYSPWRLEYILSKKAEECIFCTKPNQNDDEKHLIVYRTKLSFVIINMFPYNNGHIMAVPNRHVACLSDLTNEERNDLFELTTLCERVIKKVYSPQGINVGINLGKAAGAGIDQHLHVHLVPRWGGDCNFMTSVGGVRVLPDDFERAYKLLKEQFDKEAGVK